MTKGKQIRAICVAEREHTVMALLSLDCDQRDKHDIASLMNELIGAGNAFVQQCDRVLDFRVISTAYHLLLSELTRVQHRLEEEGLQPIVE